MGKTLNKKVKYKHKKWKFRRQKNLHEVLWLTSGVEDGSDDGEGEGNKEEKEGGDHVGCHQQRLLRRLVVDVSRLNHKHDSGDFKNFSHSERGPHRANNGRGWVSSNSELG